MQPPWFLQAFIPAQACLAASVEPDSVFVASSVEAQLVMLPISRPDTAAARKVFLDLFMVRSGVGERRVW